MNINIVYSLERRPRHHHLSSPLTLEHHLTGRNDHHCAPLPVAQNLVVVNG